ARIAARQRQSAIVAALILCAGGAMFLLDREQDELEARHVGLLSSAAHTPVSAKAVADLDAALAAANEKQLQLRQEMAAEISALHEIRAKITQFERALALEAGEETLHLGSEKTVSKRIVAGLRMLLPNTQEPRDHTPDAQAFMEMLTSLSVIREAERRPEEITRWQLALIGEFFELETSGSDVLRELLDTGYKKLLSSGLTAAEKPAEPGAVEEWCRKRDEAVRALAGRVAPLLPSSANHPELLPGLLGIGEGPRTKVEMDADGRGTASVYLPGFLERL
ncbi:MAG TPA: hypothetical protein VF614_16280, partial [Chthoniobacteraceae bacterium]